MINLDYDLEKDVTDLEKVINHPDFKKLIQEEINRLTKEKKLSSLEKPKDIYISKDGFTIENNLLTPTFKLKRNIAREYFRV